MKAMDFQTNRKTMTNSERSAVVASILRRLNPCPCCRSKADVVDLVDSYMVACSKSGCRMVQTQTLDPDAAVALWNEPRFSENTV